MTPPLDHLPAPRESSLGQILLQVDALPPLPEVAQAILRFGDGSDSGLRGLCLRIQQDVGLTGRVLRVANSPFYGLQGSVRTLDDALVVLGSATLRAIALAGALMAPFDTRSSAHFDTRRFWRHCLASGLVAQRMAPSVSVAPGLAFTAGLLHQAGVLALCAVQPAVFDRVHAQGGQAGTSFSRACRDQLGWDPSELAATLAVRWKLPGELCEALAAWRLPPAGSQPRGARPLADLVHMANRLAHLLADMPPTAWPKDQVACLALLRQQHPLDPEVVARLGPGPANLTTLLPAVARELARLESLVA